MPLPSSLPLPAPGARPDQPGGHVARDPRSVLAVSSGKKPPSSRRGPRAEWGEGDAGDPDNLSKGISSPPPSTSQCLRAGHRQ